MNTLDQTSSQEISKMGSLNDNCRNVPWIGGCRYLWWISRGIWRKLEVARLSQTDRDHYLFSWCVVLYVAIAITCGHACVHESPNPYLYTGNHGQEWELLEEQTCGNFKLSPAVLECKQCRLIL